MTAPMVSGQATFTSQPFSDDWVLWSANRQLASLRRVPRQHVSILSLGDGSTIRLQPDGWGTVVAVEDDKEWGRIVRRSWWGRRWDLISPTFGYALTSDPLPRRWTIRVGNEPVGRLAGGWLSYNRLQVDMDVAVQVLPLVLSWHVLARPWEQAAAPGSLIPREMIRSRPTLGIDG